MRFTHRNARQAVIRARQFATYPVGYCLQWVWKTLDYPTSAGCPDAVTAWRESTQKVTDRSTPPAGAPVYWSSPHQPHGHVALSVGGGRVRSTDWPNKGQVSEVDITTLEKAWHLTRLGWTRTYVTVPIDGLQAPKPAPKPAPAAALSGARVKKLQAELLRVFPAYAGRIRTLGGGPNTTYGPNTRAVVAEFQRRSHITPANGQLTAATVAALAKVGVRF